MSSKSGLSGRAIIVTGGGSGIGRATALMAASLGAKVVVADIMSQQAEEVAAAIVEAGGTAVPCIADISSWAACALMVDRCVAEFGRLDGLVNNAGLVAISPIHEMSESELRAIVDVNVFGTMAATHHALRHMLSQRSGVIVNMTSASLMGSAQLAAYGATKGAIASLTYSCAIDLAGTGVRINALAPRAQTGMTEKLSASVAATSGGGNLERPSPDISAAGACFLLSDESSALNGQLVYIDGEKLSRVFPPALSLPFSTNAHWTFDAICTAFAETSMSPLPVGISGLPAEHADFQLLRRGEMAK